MVIICLFATSSIDIIINTRALLKKERGKTTPFIFSNLTFIWVSNSHALMPMKTPKIQLKENENM